MPNPVVVKTTRGQMVENRHRGAAAICTSTADVVESWGEVDRTILPRSSIKMMQALPLIESGAADKAGLTDEHLALACASHQGAAIHTSKVLAWLEALGLSEDALLCGPQPPRDPAIRAHDKTPTRVLNNCSGKHTGFLTYAQHIGADLGGYLDPEAPVQTAIASAFADVTDTEPPLIYGIDGCSAPNYAAPLKGIATGVARFADPNVFGGVRARAAERLIAAMAAHPMLVSGEGRACLDLTEATGRRAVVKTGADGVFTGIFPEKGLGFCLKIDDGSIPACDALCAALLVRIGALDAAHPTAKKYLSAEITNFNGEVVGRREVTLEG